MRLLQDKKILISLVIFFVITFLTSVFFTTSVIAQSTPSPSPKAITLPNEPPPAGINLTLSPSFLNLTTDPGTPVISQLRVKNNSNFTEYLEFNLAKFDAADGGERPRLMEVTGEDTFINWISFSEPQFTVAPNEVKTVKFTISPPKEASLGYYYAILVKRIQEQTPAEGQAAVSGAPAFLVLLEVRTPNAKRELQIVDFRTDQTIYEYLPTEFRVKVKNSGNIHLVPAGDIFIDWGGSKDIAVFKANEGRGNILPGTERTFTAKWNDGFPMRVPKVENGKEVRDENGKTVYTTKYDFSQANKFRIGKYTAHLLLVYDNGQRDIPVEATVSFWVIPWKILGLGIIVLLFVLLGVKSTISSGVKRFRR
jgi:hypothetical protein